MKEICVCVCVCVCVRAYDLIIAIYLLQFSLNGAKYEIFKF